MVTTKIIIFFVAFDFVGGNGRKSRKIVDNIREFQPNFSIFIQKKIPIKSNQLEDNVKITWFQTRTFK